MVRYSWLLLVVMHAAASQAQDSVRPDELLASAKSAYTQEGPAAALPQFERALTIFHGEHDERNEAVTLGYLANCHRRLGNLKRALELGQQALTMKERFDDRSEIAKTHNQLGLIYWDLADYPAAIKQLEQAIEAGRSLADPQLEGSAANNLGLVYDEQGDHQASLKQFRMALELERKAHFERGEGDALGNIGGVSLLLGRFREALGYYREALAISQRLGLKPGEADDLGNIAVCLKGIGEVDESLSTFDRALAVAHDAGLTKEEADWRRGKGSALSALGRYDAALDEYGKAEKAYEQSGLKRELADSLNEKGRLYELLGDTESAAKSFHHAQDIAEQIGNKPGMLSSIIALGDLERRRKRYDAAEEYFNRAMEGARAAGDTQNVLEALIDRSINHLARNRFDAALRDVTEAKRVAEENGNKPAVALTRYLEGEVNRARRNFAQALEQYESAAAVQRELRDPELGWRILFGRGETLQAMEKDGEALASYKKSVEFIEQTRSAIAEERFRAGYIEERFQVYVALVELLLKMGKPSEAFFFSEKLRARGYFDLLGTREERDADPVRSQQAKELSEQLAKLREKIEQEYSAVEKERHGQALEMYSQELDRTQAAYEEVLQASRAISRGRSTVGGVSETSAIQERIPAGTGLIEYVVGKQSLSILVIRSDAVNGIEVPVSGERIATKIELFRDLILAKKGEWVAPGRGLAAILVAPLERAGYLHHIQRLIIVPDGVLNYIPFAALPTHEERVLGDDFIIGYLPAASAILHETHRKGSSHTLLAMAPSATHLPNAVSEIRSIGELFPQAARVVSGRGATKTLFKQVAGEYDFVHLATHGSLNRNAPWLSTLQLQPDSESDGRLELHEVLDLKLHARLVTLSACETALGSGYFNDTPAGNEFVGMARAFLGAGSDSVLASLWTVNDESTRALMVRFYRNLRRYDGPEALARAQREIRLSDLRYREPYYWAPFVLTGESK